MQMLLIDGTSSFIKDEAVLRWASLRYYKHDLICISVCGRQSDESRSFLIDSRQILPEQNSRLKFVSEGPFLLFHNLIFGGFS